MTVLRILGLPADEGKLAIAAQAGPAVGTNPQRLAAAITRRYAAERLRCEYRHVAKLEAMPIPAIANLSSNVLRDHYVAVLEVTADFVVIGDPLSGRERLSREDFLAEWTHAAHVFLRDHKSETSRQVRRLVTSGGY